MIGVVRAEEDRDLELNVHADSVEQEAKQDRAGVEIEHVLNAVVGVVVQELVQPLQGVFVGLTDAAEIACDGRGSAEVRVGAVGAFCVERLHEGGADDVQRGDDGGQVAVRFGFLHLPDGDKSPGHKSLGHRWLASPSRRTQGKYCKRGDFQRDRVFILNLQSCGASPSTLRR